jgi:hypothetical protein
VTKSNVRRTRRDIVTLADLAPRRDIKGGAGQRVFGADAIDAPESAARSTTKVTRVIGHAGQLKQGRHGGPHAGQGLTPTRKGETMDTKKTDTEATTITTETPRQPLKVNDDTLKDLTPESRAAQQVKGGVPKQPDNS